MRLYPTLEEISICNFRKLSSIYPNYSFNSNEGNMIVPVNYIFNMARAVCNKTLSYQSSLMIQPVSLKRIADASGIEMLSTEFLSLDELANRFMECEVDLYYEDDDWDEDY